MATIQEHLNAIALTSKKTEQEAANILAGKTGNFYTTQEALKVWAGITTGSTEDAIMSKCNSNRRDGFQGALKKLSGLN